ncbi:lipoate--protein ligase family protein [bacterium]|nr:lipoate--protein ligase family protein [bacterium]
MNAVLSDSLWRWLDNGSKDGAWNMAADQFLTERMAEICQPVMRVYQWKPWCISLGYHQDAECIDLVRCRESGVDVVRRQTGGRAVFHAEEMTYSVILPRDHAIAASATETYHRLSYGLANGLRRLGVPASFQKRSVNLKKHYSTKISASCFAAASLHEIVIHGKKLVGSAQRRMPTGVLQHGSILIGPAHQHLFCYMKGLSDNDVQNMRMEISEKTTCISEWVDSIPDHETIAAALKEEMAGILGIRFEDKTMSSDELYEIEKRQYRFSVLKNTE